jgi:cysteine-rich repeat protein
VDPGEDCDDGNAVNDDNCRNNCVIPICGDGILDPGEECDDGNDTDDDGCSADCRLENICDLNVIKTADPDTIIPEPAPSCEERQ